MKMSYRDRVEFERLSRGAILFVRLIVGHSKCKSHNLEDGQNDEREGYIRRNG